ncbi:MAG: polysaccharide deacetylase family protein [Bacteroidota bacterium]
MKKTLFSFLIISVVTVCSAQIPDKTVVLTFDDGVKSHLTVAAPVLAENGFGATFFVCQAWRDDVANFLSWEEIAELHNLGFEVGNHSWNHVALHDANAAQIAVDEIKKVEDKLAEVGVPKPVSFSWPGNHTGPETIGVLRDRGYKFARRGPFPGEMCEPTVIGAGPLYDPVVNDPLLVPSTGLSVTTWTVDDFRKIAEKAKDGKAAIFQFHGVPDNGHPECTLPEAVFRDIVAYLKAENYNVIDMRELEQYIDPENKPMDWLTKMRITIPTAPLSIPVTLDPQKTESTAVTDTLETLKTFAAQMPWVANDNYLKWNTFSNYFPESSVVYQLEQYSDEIDILTTGQPAADGKGEPSYSFGFINRSSSVFDIELKIISGINETMEKYYFSSAPLDLDEEGLPISIGETLVSYRTITKIRIEAQGITLLATPGIVVCDTCTTEPSTNWKVNSDQWSMTDALGRTTPNWYETGKTNEEKYIGIFYHTWHTDNLAESNFTNLTEFLEIHPDALPDYEHPAWNETIGDVFFWDEPLFGYYRTTDEWVLRKHGEMLADAGVDAVFFDATNQNITWKSSYMKLLEVWEQARKDGVKTPHIAFLLPFGPTPGALEAIYELYTDLYGQGLYEDLWFQWKGKPLIMAYPEMLNSVTPADAAGFRFTAYKPFTNIDVNCPSWSNNIGSLTMSLYQWKENYRTSISQEPLVTHRFIDYADNSLLNLECGTLPAGEYVWELNEAEETVGLWKYVEDTDSTVSYFNGTPVGGDYEVRIKFEGEEWTYLTFGDWTTHVPIQLLEGNLDQGALTAMKDLFTFRPGQPGYTSGPTRPDHWGWLESYPQHGFNGNASTGYEQVTVGIAQNANDVSGGNCASFNSPGAYGRSYSKLNGFDTRDSAYLWGANFEEQWDRAYEIDPELVWITGWNEWIFGRYKDWAGCQGGPQVENGFPDGFDADRSRDIEPVKAWGRYGDVYYNQLVDKVRRFKGMAKTDSVSKEISIQIGTPGSWEGVLPEFWHYRGNTMERNHRGHGQSLIYTNTTGRNDIVLAKVARDQEFLYFYVETADNLTSSSDPGWMRLFIDTDRDKSSGWEGYDYMVNRVSPGTKALLERNVGGDWVWTGADSVEFTISGKILELKIPGSSLGMNDLSRVNFEFKWSDNMQEEGNIMDFYENGDAAPGGRWNFVYNTRPIVDQTAYKAIALPGTVECEDFDYGGQGHSYFDSDPANQGAVYRPDEEVDIIQLDEEDAYAVNWIEDGEWMEYTVKLELSGSYWLNLHYALESGTARVIMLVDGKAKTDTIALPATGDSSVYDMSSDLLVLPKGTHTLQLRIVKTSPGLSLDRMEFSGENLAYPGNGEGLWRSIWTAKAGGRGWFVDSLCAAVVPVVDTTWSGSPGCDAPADFWNARWQGKAEPLFSEEYTFYLTSSDISRLWINGELLIDGWSTSHAGETLNATVTMEAGQKVPIQVDFGEYQGDASIRLEWSSATLEREVIPQSQLYPEIATGIPGRTISHTTTYPNPFSEYITMEFHLSSPGKVNLSVYNNMGQEVRNIREQFSTTGTHRFQWNGDDASGNKMGPGIYFFRLTTGNGSRASHTVMKL